MIQEHYEQLTKGWKPLSSLQDASSWEDEDLVPYLVDAVERHSLYAFLHVHRISDETWFRIKENYAEEFI